MLIVNTLMQHCNAQFYASAKVVTRLQTIRIEETPHKVSNSMFMIDINLYDNFSKKSLNSFPTMKIMCTTFWKTILFHRNNLSFRIG